MARYDKLVLATRGNSPDRGNIQLFIDWNRNLIELDYTILIPFRKQFLLSYLSYAIQKRSPFMLLFLFYSCQIISKPYKK